MSRNLVWKIIPGILIIISLLAGVFIYKQGIKKERKPQEVVTNSPTPVVNTTISPTPSALEEVDLSKYKIQVLNGSGIAGVAAKTKTKLEEKGFVVAVVSNASESTYKETVIQTSENIPDLFINKLKDILEETYSVKDTEDSISDIDFDIVVIIGRDKVR